MSINKRIVLVGVDASISNVASGITMITFDGNGADGASISGFKIVGIAGGNGISCKDGAEPTIRYNSISGVENGIYCDHSSGTITNNTISGNSSWGIGCSYSSPLITNNLITKNGYGGIGCSGSSPLITTNIITENGQQGILLDGSSPSITNNTISLNGQHGIFNRGGSNPSINSNTISGNGKRGIDISDSSGTTIINNIILGNYEGGIFCFWCNPTISNNTIVGNRKKGGIECWCSSPTILNNIISANDYGIYFGGEFSPPTINYNCVSGNGQGGNNNYYTCSAGPNDIPDNPQFIGNGNYHLGTSSPCIDAGSNTAPAMPATDKDGKPRIINGMVDIGAYEYQGTSLATGSFDLRITKQGLTKIGQNQMMTYQISYRNIGNSDAGSVTITDILPTNTTYISDTLGEAQGTQTNTITWNIGTMTKNTSKYFELMVMVGSITGYITNCIKIDSVGTDTNLANNLATWTTGVNISYVDLAVNEWGVGDVPQSCTTTRIISYSNKGNIVANNVKIVCTLPCDTSGTFVYVSNTSGKEPIITGSGTLGNPYILTWNIGTLSSCSWNKTFEVNLRADICPGFYDNCVSISSDETDDNPGDNRATGTIYVMTPVADVWILQSGPRQGITAGGEFDDEIVYCENAFGGENVEAPDCIITAYLPDGVTYLSDTSGKPVVVDQGTITWTIGTVRHSGVKFSMRLRVGTDAAGTTLIIPVQIQTSYPNDPVGNNWATVTIKVNLADYDLSIDNRGESQITTGREMEYWISYRNSGNETIGSVTITDTLPLDVTYLSDTSGLPISKLNNQITWSVGTLSPSPLSYSFVVKVKVGTNATGSLVNLAKIQGGATETILSNNTSTWTTMVVEPRVNLRVKKFGPAEVCPNSKIAYSIWYWNLGNADSGTVTITDTLPSGVTYGTASLSPSSTNTTAFGQFQITWTIP